MLRTDIKNRSIEEIETLPHVSWSFDMYVTCNMLHDHMLHVTWFVAFNLDDARRSELTWWMKQSLMARDNVTYSRYKL